jgi:hypothetical protein
LELGADERDGPWETDGCLLAVGIEVGARLREGPKLSDGDDEGVLDWEGSRLSDGELVWASAWHRRAATATRIMKRIEILLRVIMVEDSIIYRAAKVNRQRCYRVLLSWAKEERQRSLGWFKLLLQEANTGMRVPSIRKAG